MSDFTATYSPDDNKLRLSVAYRLDPDVYEIVKAAGFRWAPRQKIFVAPAWTPEREDLALELAGEIGDEDTTLADRAEDRAERFGEYQEKRLEEANRAKDAVDAIADGIPLGQPILVGHHSEKHARKDAERIRSGMANAVRLWDTAQYWKSRAAGALRHAKYKELPPVRHRRIKTLNAELRGYQRRAADLVQRTSRWSSSDLTRERAIAIMRATYDSWAEDRQKDLESGAITLEEIVAQKLGAYGRAWKRLERWIRHLENRIAYETAMLDEQIGTAGETGPGMAGRFDVAPGGKVLIGREWLLVLRVNRAGGAVNSVTTSPPRAVTWSSKWKIGIEKVLDYQPPTADLAELVKKTTDLPPLCNYPGEGFKEMTAAEWKRTARATDSAYVGILEATATVGRHRARQCLGRDWTRLQVFLTDSKRVDPPAPIPPEQPRCPDCGDDVPTIFEHVAGCPETETETETVDSFMTITGTPGARTTEALVATAEHAFEAMRKGAREGVKVVTVRNLFPTPMPVAARVIALAGIEKGDQVLEPSAGTGNLVVPAIEAGGDVLAVELNADLCEALVRRIRALPDQGLSMVVHGDFFEMENDLFDKIVMNPPFENGVDIKHVEHALTMLKPGGRLVAIMADGPRQRKWVEARGTHWESLPPDTFEGTSVRALIAVFDAHVALVTEE